MSLLLLTLPSRQGLLQLLLLLLLVLLRWLLLVLVELRLLVLILLPWCLLKLLVIIKVYLWFIYIDIGWEEPRIILELIVFALQILLIVLFFELLLHWIVEKVFLASK